MSKANRLRRKAKEKDRARRRQQRPAGQTPHHPFFQTFSGNPLGGPSATEQVELVADEATYATVNGDDNLVQTCVTRLAEQGDPRLVDRVLRRVLEQERHPHLAVRLAAGRPGPLRPP